MDIHEAVRKNLGIAKQALAKDRFLANVILLVKDGGDTMPVPHKTFEGVLAQESKYRNALMAGSLAKMTGADMVVMVWDAAMRTVPADREDEIDETETPLSYPKSMRTECIIVHGVDFRDGDSHLEVAPYKGGDGEPVEFLEPDKSLDDAPKDTWFEEVIRKGYDECSR